MNFGQALEEIKSGNAVSREGWNGKGMFIYLQKGSQPFDSVNGDDDLPQGKLTEGIKNELFESGNSGTVRRLPNLNMKAATGAIVTGWLASQTDLLAEDWGVVIDKKHS